MDWELAYTVCNATAAVCWMPLVLALRAPFTRQWTATPLPPMAFALVYTALAVRMIAGDGGGSMDSLADLRRGFASDPVLLLAWVHYLSFDMLVGFWIARDSTRLRLNTWVVRICLIFTFMLGPVGLLMYAGLRLASGRGLRFDAAPPADGAGLSG
jgi:hypothetical protein